MSYLAGFVAKKIKDGITCETCVGALTSIGSDFYHNNELLINIKSEGYLTRPSNDVSIIVFMMAEKKFKEIVSSNYKILKPSSIKYLVNAVLQSFLFSDIFSSLNLHAIECSPLENHIFLLIKLNT